MTTTEHRADRTHPNDIRLSLRVLKPGYTAGLQHETGL